MPNSLAGKLLIKAGASVLFLHQPEGYPAALGDMPPDVTIEMTGRRAHDVVMLFVKSQAELASKSKRAVAAVRPGGILWITYPKQSGAVKADINRDSTWKVMEPTGWRPVTQVSIDETWSALRFRPVADVGKR